MQYGLALVRHPFSIDSTWIDKASSPYSCLHAHWPYF